MSLFSKRNLRDRNPNFKTLREINPVSPRSIYFQPQCYVKGYCPKTKRVILDTDIFDKEQKQEFISLKDLDLVR